MAKKKQNLSPEEMLEQALVPDHEWPYSVPENWVWIRFGSLVRIIGGGTPSKSNPNYWNGDIPWASVKDVKGDYLFETVDKISEFGLVNSSANLADINDLILVTRIEPGKTIIPQIRVAVNQDLKIIKSKLPIKFLHYYFKNFMNEFVKQASGSTVLGITLDKVQSTEFPLPPIAEQHRIVERIESLFEKLDQAKELIQVALDSFENRKAAILHKAFSGELTKQWREENGIGMESWEETYINDVCIKVTDGTHKSPKNYEYGEYKYVTAKNIKENGVDLSNITYISEEDHMMIYPRCNVEYGDVLYIKDGATTGIATVNTLEEQFSLLSSVALLKVDKNKIISNYLALLLNSPDTKARMINSMSGNAITRLTIKKIKEALIIVPTIREQHEIINIVEDVLKNETDAKVLYDVVDEINLMKKSILARAFRGELGTNDASDESAINLLKELF